MVGDGLTHDETMEIMDRFENLYRQAVVLAVPVAVDTLLTATDEQIDFLEEKLEEDNEEYRKDLDAGPDERLAKRAEDTVESIESWTGRLSRDQRALVTQLSQSLPDNDDAWYEYGLIQQDKLMVMLRSGTDAGTLEQFLSDWWLGDNAESEAIVEGMEEMRPLVQEMVVQIFNNLEDDQLDSIVRRLDRYYQAFAGLIDTECTPTSMLWPRAAFQARLRLTRCTRNVTLFRPCLCAALCAGLSLAAHADVKVDVIKNPYGGQRNVPELSTNPDYIHAAGLERLIDEWGGDLIRPVRDIRLTAEQENHYGAWNRMALANANFADAVRDVSQDDLITIGLEANCNDLLGMLAGLKYDSNGDTRRVGLVFIDAHGDFNTPETTLSGMLGGMPVAVAAGHALHNIRKTAGLHEPLPMSHIVWGGVRDLDPLEAERFDEYSVQQFSVQDIRELSANLRQQIDALATRVDVIYVHIDMDVLDPAEVPGHDLAVDDGPSSKELAAAIALMFENPKTAALGIASTPAFNLDPDGISRQAALNLIEGAISGAQAR